MLPIIVSVIGVFVFWLGCRWGDNKKNIFLKVGIGIGSFVAGYAAMIILFTGNYLYLTHVSHSPFAAAENAKMGESSGGYFIILTIIVAVIEGRRKKNFNKIKAEALKASSSVITGPTVVVSCPKCDLNESVKQSEASIGDNYKKFKADPSFFSSGMSMVCGRCMHKFNFTPPNIN